MGSLGRGYMGIKFFFREGGWGRGSGQNWKLLEDSFRVEAYMGTHHDDIGEPKQHMKWKRAYTWFYRSCMEGLVRTGFGGISYCITTQGIRGERC